MPRTIKIIAILFLLFANTTTGFSQNSTELPTYLVQPGDTLGIIAQRFGISLDDLIRANAINNPNSIAVGMPLKIPGLDGINGTLTTQPVPLGETFFSLSGRYQITDKLLARLNRITNPQEIYAGASLILPVNTQIGTLIPVLSSEPGSSLLEQAVTINQNPWAVLLTNQKKSSAEIIPGSTVFFRPGNNQKEINPISPRIKQIQIKPLPLVQGATATIRVVTDQPVNLSGKIAGRELHFFKEADNSYVALQGIHAMAPIGLTDFNLKVLTERNVSVDFDEMLVLKSGLFPNDPPLTVDPKTIDPEITKPEEEIISKVIAKISPIKFWDKLFRVPVDEPVCYKSTFGNRRSYNGSPYSSFHGGDDFGVCANLNIYAPADGVVVFAGPLSVRGNATIIDHGWGVFSGYWHQKEIKVSQGDQVKKGQLIGLIGATGRVTGPHLHWEIIVNGVQVEPVDWLEKVFP